MHRIGWIGLGRLGLPCATAMASRGFEVFGYDPAPQTVDALDYEAGLADLADFAPTVLDSVERVVAVADVVFVAVQTPHEPAFDGTRPMSDDRADFEVAYLANAVRRVCEAALERNRPITMAVVSTVLPGTWHRVIEPLLNPMVHAAYTPSLIAMGTTVADWLRPEMVLLGTDDAKARGNLVDVFSRLHDRPVVHLRPVEAELVKMSYNAFIGLKIVYANWLMEVCHHTGADVDAVSGALAQATDRIVSPRYLSAGMGDGGGCHPRDNLALSWLAERYGLSVDVAGFAMKAREAQTGWLADMVDHWAALTGLPVVLCGIEYKAGVPLTAGSPAALLRALLASKGLGSGLVQYGAPIPARPSVFVVSTNHDRWSDEKWPAGSVVLDPWGMVPDQPGVTVVRVGRAR